MLQPHHPFDVRILDGDSAKTIPIKSYLSMDKKVLPSIVAILAAPTKDKEARATNFQPLGTPCSAFTTPLKPRATSKSANPKTVRNDNYVLVKSETRDGELESDHGEGELEEEAKEIEEEHSEVDAEDAVAATDDNVDLQIKWKRSGMDEPLQEGTRVRTNHLITRPSYPEKTENRTSKGESRTGATIGTGKRVEIKAAGGI